MIACLAATHTNNKTTPTQAERPQTRQQNPAQNGTDHALLWSCKACHPCMINISSWMLCQGAHKRHLRHSVIAAKSLGGRNTHAIHECVQDISQHCLERQLLWGMAAMVYKVITDHLSKKTKQQQCHSSWLGCCGGCCSSRGLLLAAACSLVCRLLCCFPFLALVGRWWRVLDNRLGLLQGAWPQHTRIVAGLSTQHDVRRVCVVWKKGCGA